MEKKCVGPVFWEAIEKYQSTTYTKDWTPARQLVFFDIKPTSFHVLWRRPSPK
jgi:hypothetical protein